MKKFIERIKKKKELNGVSDSLVKDVLNEYLRKKNIDIAKLKATEKKIVVGEIRAILRKKIGMFQSSFKKRKKMLENKDIDLLLRSHVSSKERIRVYSQLKRLIKSLKVKSVLDLGCGLNPIALAESGIYYNACDVKEDELDIVKEYFKIKKIGGRVFVCDLSKKRKFPKSELCLILKVFDIVGRKNAEEILKCLNCKYLIISFSTRKLSGKKMNRPRRFWFEKMIDRLKWKFKVWETDNEVFYLTDKNS